MIQNKTYYKTMGILLVLALLFSMIPTGLAQAASVGKVALQSAKTTSNSKIKVSWQKVKKANGYQVKISKKKNGSGIVYDKTTTKKNITTGKLAAGTYYVKVRAFRKVSGKKVYGTWSKIKKVKITSTTGKASTDNGSDESGSSTDNGSGKSGSSTDSSDNNSSGTGNQIGTVANTIALDTDALVSTYAGKFSQQTYTDSSTGLSVTYNLYLPENYDTSKTYPMVVFIADSSCTGNDATKSLTQGRGALVWATAEWQAANPSIVVVPTYPITILDDHSGYTTTDYVELTKRLIDSVSSDYSVDTNRIYGTGQSMGCMTTLILASKYPELYAACMFVDGQWDVTTLSGLEGQKFVYFAAEDDTSAYKGMQEVMDMFQSDSKAFTYQQWDGAWTPDQLTSAATNLFSAGTNANFISWKTGTIELKTGTNGSGDSGRTGGPVSGGGIAGGNGGGANSSSYHMASFDYAYNCIAVMEWLFQQAKSGS